MRFGLRPLPRKQTVQNLEVGGRDSPQMPPDLFDGPAEHPHAQRRMKSHETCAVEYHLSTGILPNPRQSLLLLSAPEIFFRGGMPSKSGQMLFNAGIDLRKERKNLMAKPVAGIPHIGVGRVFNPDQPLGNEVVPDPGAGESQKGANETVTAETHSGQSGKSSAAEKTMQDRFGLIAPVVPEGNPAASAGCGDALQKSMPELAGRLFDPDLPSLCLRSHLDPLQVERNFETGTELRDERGIALASIPQSMIEVGRVEGERIFGRQTVQKVQQGHGIGSAGHGDQNAIPRGNTGFLQGFSKTVAHWTPERKSPLPLEEGFCTFGGGAEIRTPDTADMSRML